jgi:hypothetical protein
VAGTSFRCRSSSVTGWGIFDWRLGDYCTGDDTNGQSAFLSRFTDPSELVCVTLLANKDGLDLTQLARRIAGAFDPRLGPPLTPDGSRFQQSPYSARETHDRLAAISPEFRSRFTVMEENGQVWVAYADSRPPMRERLDRLALSIVTPY